MKGALTSCRWHDDRGRGGDHCSHCNGAGSGARAGAGCQDHCLLLRGCIEDGGGAQFGHCGVVLRFGQDIGHKVWAGRSCHNDHLEEDKTLKPDCGARWCTTGGQSELTFCVVVLVVWMVGLVKVILTGDRCGGSELAMLCMMLLILGLLLTGTVMFLDTCGDTLVTSFSITGDELEELVRLLLRGFSSSSEQLTPLKS